MPVRGVTFPAAADKKLTAKAYLDALSWDKELEAAGVKGVEKAKLIAGALSEQISLLPHMLQLKGSEGTSSLLTTSRALLALLSYYFFFETMNQTDCQKMNK